MRLRREGGAVAIVSGTEQLYFDACAWCAFYGALRGAFAGWRYAERGAENPNGFKGLGD